MINNKISDRQFPRILCALQLELTAFHDQFISPCRVKEINIQIRIETKAEERPLAK
jgi:hypothetical protein